MNFYKKTSQVHYDSETFSIFAFIFVLSFLQYRSNNPRLASRLLKCCYNLVLMVGTECFHGDPKFHGCISVGAYKLVMIKLDYITISVGNYLCNSYKFTRLIWKKYRYSKYSASLNKTLLDSRLNLIKDSVISIGTVNSSLVSVKEVFSEACKNKAVSIVLIHNHPSGDPAPSPQDISVTEQIRKAGLILGIHLIDHIIIGDNNFTSLNECGYLRQ